MAAILVAIPEILCHSLVILKYLASGFPRQAFCILHACQDADWTSQDNYCYQ